MRAVPRGEAHRQPALEQGSEVTRHTANKRTSRGSVHLEVTVERDESNNYRHEWRTTLRFGLLTGTGPNQRAAAEALAERIAAMAWSEGAQSALFAEQEARAVIYRAEAEVFGVDVAAERASMRARGQDPDAAEPYDHENDVV
jgi:hypothetical protein